MLSVLIYQSSANEAFTAEQLRRLASRSSEANASAGITGVLLFDGRRFLQVLEGPEPEVQALFQRLLADPRHRDVQTVLHTGATQRSFSGWSMRLLDVSISTLLPVPEAILDCMDQRVRACLEAFMRPG